MHCKLLTSGHLHLGPVLFAMPGEYVYSQHPVPDRIGASAAPRPVHEFLPSWRGQPQRRGRVDDNATVIGTVLYSTYVYDKKRKLAEP